MLSVRRRGFTMVELLVVMSIIAVLIAMLLPAVNVAREAGRRSRCANNIRQLGLALNSYHQTHKTFPPAMFVAKDEDPTTTTKHQINWLICLLRFIEQEPVYKKFDFKKPLIDKANYEARNAYIPLLLCPTDSGSDVRFARSGEGDGWSRSNYAANSSLADLSKNNVGMSSPHWSQGWIRGVMGANVACTIDEIYDGVTNTILLEEVRIGLAAADRRGTWALGGPGSSSVWGHRMGPNNCGSSADYILGCAELSSDPGRSILTRQCMGCNQSGRNSRATTRSRHPGGVNVCMADASVRFITDSIDRGTTGTPDAKNRPQDFRIWERLNASADRLPVDMTQF